MNNNAAQRVASEITEAEVNSKPLVILKLAALQALGTMCLAAGLYYCFDAREAISALLGGAIASVMSLFMAGRLFASFRISKLRDVASEETLMRFYISAALKICFTLAMMSICIVVLNVSILPFVIAYLVAAIIVNLLFVRLNA
jgi:F0F1-type ATP synthase assembly protein I